MEDAKKDKDNDKCCGLCAYFYDEWNDGTGKCEKAHGGITTSENQCELFRYYIE